MSDWDSIAQDALDDEQRILEENDIQEYNDFDDAKLLKKDAKIDKQPIQVQKYWLGKLAYEFAIRNNDVKNILKKCDVLSNQVDLYEMTNYSPQRRCRTIKLYPHGFSAQPEKDVLKTKLTSYPARLDYKSGYIEINTIKKITKLFKLIDGATAKECSMNPKTYSRWKDIGNVYINGGYHELLEPYSYEDDINSSDYNTTASKQSLTTFTLFKP